MGPDFVSLTIRDLGRIVTGKTPPTKDHENYGGDIPFVSPRDLNGQRYVLESERTLTLKGAQAVKNAKIPRDSILVSCIGSDMGKAAIAARDCVTNQQINSLVVSPDFDFKYVYYNLSTRKEEIRSLAGGSAQPILNKTDFGKIEIDVPASKEEQQAVSSFLSALDDKIELNRQINTTLESMAQALFKSWFVDFDPVIDNALAVGNSIPEPLQSRAEKRAALLATAPAVASRSANAMDDSHPTQTAPHTQPGTTAPATPLQPLPADLRALFPDSFVFNAEMGWVPEGWKVSTAGNEFAVLGGSTPSTKKPEYWENGEVHWTTPKDLSGSQTKLLIDTERRITAEGLQTITSGLLPVNTVLMSSRAPVGYLAISKVPLAINQGYIALTCKNTCSPEYAIQWLESIIDHVKSISGGTTFSEISKKTFRGIKLIVPSVSAANSYTEIVRSNYEKILANEKETRSLVQIRDSLLPKLLSGELKVGVGRD